MRGHELASLLAQFLEQLLHPHDPKLGSRELEAVALHPLQGLLGVEPLHHQLLERVQCRLGVQLERLLRAVPAAV